VKVLKIGDNVTEHTGKAGHGEVYVNPEGGTGKIDGAAEEDEIEDEVEGVAALDVVESTIVELIVDEKELLVRVFEEELEVDERVLVDNDELVDENFDEETLELDDEEDLIDDDNDDEDFDEETLEVDDDEDLIDDNNDDEDFDEETFEIEDEEDLIDDENDDEEDLLEDDEVVGTAGPGTQVKVVLIRITEVLTTVFIGGVIELVIVVLNALAVTVLIPLVQPRVVMGPGRMKISDSVSVKVKVETALFV
jgi:hypothetical protein